MRGQPQRHVWWCQSRSSRSALISSLFLPLSGSRALLFHRAHCSACASNSGPASHRGRILVRSRYRSGIVLPSVPHSVARRQRRSQMLCRGVEVPRLVLVPGSPLGGGRLRGFRGYLIDGSCPRFTASVSAERRSGSSGGARRSSARGGGAGGAVPWLAGPSRSCSTKL